jgi:hypothetical protein
MGTSIATPVEFLSSRISQRARHGVAGVNGTTFAYNPCKGFSGADDFMVEVVYRQGSRERQVHDPLDRHGSVGTERGPVGPFAPLAVIGVDMSFSRSGPIPNVISPVAYDEISKRISIQIDATFLLFPGSSGGTDFLSSGAN